MKSIEQKNTFGEAEENSLQDIGDEDDGQYPREDVDASKSDKKLQKEHPVSEAKDYIAESPPCPKCGKSSKDLEWFYFSSPEETWEMLCGTEGWMGICPDCNIQVSYYPDRVS